MEQEAKTAQLTGSQPVVDEQKTELGTATESGPVNTKTSADLEGRTELQ